MGNCCTGGAQEDRQSLLASDDCTTFQGEGYRLGTADEVKYTAPTANAMHHEESLEPAITNPYLTDEDRERQRADRAAAAEARLTKQGGQTKKKKPKTGTELIGPNSQPTMRWTAGS